VIPPYLIAQRDQDRIRRRTVELARLLGVVGLMNIQYAIAGGELWVLEVNPRASRTVPYVSKATGVPFAKLAACVMAGRSLPELGLTAEPKLDRYYVKAPVFPFGRFPREDTVLGPEMKSTGEVMGSSDSFGEAYSKALLGAGVALPVEGRAFISVHDDDKKSMIVEVARELVALGFDLVATGGTRDFLATHGITTEAVFKIHEGRPHIGDRMINDEIALVINTPLGRSAFYDDTYIRRIALQRGIPCLTTLSAAMASVEGIRDLQTGPRSVIALQD
jgi:carbamoyl-phosphate synthase large subunit